MYEARIQLENFKGIAENLYIQSHGMTGRLLVIPTKEVDDISVPHVYDKNNSVSVLDIEKFMELETKERGVSENGFSGKLWLAINEIRIIASYMKDGGTLIFGACNAGNYDDDNKIEEEQSDRLLIGLQKLTGNRLNIVLSRDYVSNIRSYTVRNKKTRENLGKIERVLDLGRSGSNFKKGWRILKINENKPKNTGKDLKLNSKGDSHSNNDGSPLE